MPDIFSSFTLGGLALPSRIVMAPMTRSRASMEGVPSPLAPTYYAQRASAGLIVTEASQISAQGVGYIRTPGCYTDEMVDAWSAVTETVHATGGRIYLQIWHVGRTSHPDFHGGTLPVAPSAIGYDGEVFTPDGKKTIVTPRALDASELPGIVEDFARAARNAMRAGFDGVEIHGANSYLLDQFLRDGSNQRDDAYGGSVENRARFPLEVVDAVIAEIGAAKTGYRINPLNIPPFGMLDSDPKATFGYLVGELSARSIGYLHVLEPLTTGGDVHGQEVAFEAPERLTPHFRSLFDGPLIANGGYTKATAEAALASGEADLIAFGALFLANPDLPERLRGDAPLNKPDPDTFYQGEEKGYTDYPTLAEVGLAEVDHE
ncbi:MAG: alkene reductase [Pseudomonadota bacterium]